MPDRLRTSIALAGVLTAAGLAAFAGAPSPAAADAGGVCVPSDPPVYYAIELVTTRNIPGTGYVDGTADVTFRPAPFGVSVAPDGSYAYDVHVRFDGLKPPLRGTYVAWVTDTEVDEIHRLGALDADMTVSGLVAWNKFLVVITLEETDDPDAARWSGPIAFRGMSRSGRMHTMIGHGPLQEEKCAAYGYAN